MNPRRTSVVQVRCRDCSSCLELPPAQVEVLECTNVPSLTTLGYRCPLCGPQLRSLSSAERCVVVFHGVPVRRWESEQPAPAVSTPPPLNLDDLIGFHASVDRELRELLDGAA